MAAAAAIIAALVASALLDFLALPQIPYLFCFVAAMAVVLAKDRNWQRSARSSKVAPKIAMDAR
jgi:hypothetical protein